MNEKIKTLGGLFFSFIKIGAFTFGGGYAMIPLIQREVAEKHGWITEKDILDIFAVAESTPGPIAINTATFVGKKVGGFAGAFLATLGVVLPSFVIISLIAFALRQFRDIKAVKYAFNGIRAGVLALIVKALVSMYRQCPKSRLSYALMAAAFVCAAFLGVNVLLVIAVCAAMGLTAALLSERRGKA